jgi:hypothetical protein
VRSGFLEGPFFKDIVFVFTDRIKTINVKQTTFEKRPQKNSRKADNILIKKEQIAE